MIARGAPLSGDTVPARGRAALVADRSSESVRFFNTASEYAARVLVFHRELCL